MLFITGDTHADFKRFNTANFPQQKEMTRDDTVLIMGDFGGVWCDREEERYWLKWLSEKPFTVCFVDGNHENFDRLYGDEFELVDYHGGKAHKIRDNIYHLMRGYVFEFEGKKFFAFGGASSHDIHHGILDRDDFKSDDDFKRTYNLLRYLGKSFRVNHISWWKEELPSRQEMEFGLETLEKNNWEVDYVISHCLPQEICSMLGFHTSDSLTIYFNGLIQNKLKFKEWHAGHYHRQERIMSKFYIHYEDIARIL